MTISAQDLAQPTQSSSAANVLYATGELDASQADTELRLPDGRTLTFPTSWFEAATNRGSHADNQMTSTKDEGAAEPVTLALAEESLQVGKRVVPTGKVILNKTVQEFTTTLDELLAVRSFDVERVVLNQPVETAPPVRQEGSTTIYPLVEEQLILTRQLVLKEELRVTQRDSERRDQREVTLRREHIEVQREPV